MKRGGDFASCVQEWRDQKARGAQSNGASQHRGAAYDGTGR
jgi:hypothetical protein